MGKQAAQEIAAVFGIYDDAQLDRFLGQVGRTVLSESHLRAPGTAERFLETPITFQILDSPNINAMAIPGGHIYVTRGLLAHLNSVDQLAFVLAHEIGHVSARHAARRAWQQQFGQGLLLGGRYSRTGFWTSGRPDSKSWRHCGAADFSAPQPRR